MKLRILFASALGLVISHSAHAAWKTKAETKLDLQPMYYIEDVGQGTTQLTTALRGQVDFSARPEDNKNFRFKLTPYIYSDPASPSDSEHFIFDLPQAAIETQRDDMTVKIGMNSVAWGFTDVFNPLDVVSAHRYMDPLNSEKRGVPSVDFIYDTGEWRAEGIYIPQQLVSIMPGEKSRWLPRDIVLDRKTDNGELILAPNFEYHYADPSVRDDALHNNFGFRVEHHGSGLDLAAIFFQGAPTAPAILIPRVTGTLINAQPYVNLASDITLEPAYYLRRTVGLGAVLTLDTMIIRFEASNSDRMDDEADLPGWAQAAVLGFEKNIPVGSEYTLTTLLQLTYGNHEDQADNTITSLDRIFDQSAMLGFRFTTSSNWDLLAAGLYDARYQGGYATLHFDRRLGEGVNSSLEANWIDGGATAPLGTYRRNKRLIAEISYSF